jgi:H+/Cl- antiporter ClcA
MRARPEKSPPAHPSKAVAINHLPESLSDSGSYAPVGMAAATAASIQAPPTASVMVFELSGEYLIVLPLILATHCWYVHARGTPRDDADWANPLHQR